MGFRKEGWNPHDSDGLIERFGLFDLMLLLYVFMYARIMVDYTK